jgi:hypothetical protein
LDRLNLLNLWAVALARASERVGEGGSTLVTGNGAEAVVETVEVRDEGEGAVAAAMEVVGGAAVGEDITRFGRFLERGSEDVSTFETLNLIRQFRPEQLSQNSPPGIVYLPTK